MAPKRHPVPDLGDLDDAILLKCFSLLTPLPDLFNVAASCRRFRDLALDRRSWLYVTHTADSSAPSPAPKHDRPPPTPAAPSPACLCSPAGAARDDSPHWYRSRFATLAAAVAASRPGDTILLEPGPAPHLVGSPVVVPHPLHILGGGAAAEGCVVRGAPGLDAVVDFRASGRLANLTVQAVSGACVGHTRGRLTVQGCQLECDARGLPHLVAPLLTRAVSWPHSPKAAARPPLEPTAAGAPTVALLGSKRPAPDAPPEGQPGGGWDVAAEPPAAKRLREWRRGAEAAAGAGLLSVAETRIKARGSAVELRGSGRLSAVRAIYSYSHTLVWLQVDSADKGSGAGCSGVVASGAAEAAAPASGDSAAPPATPAPSWAARAAAAGFDPAAFQRRVAALLTPSTAAGAEAGQPAAAAATGDGGMERKAEEWCVRHHAALAPPPAAAAATSAPDSTPAGR